MNNRGKAYRRWKTFSKYVSRIKERLYYMKVQYGEVESTTTSGKMFKKKLWRSPESWKEVEEVGTAGSKLLKKTPTPYTEPWKKVYDKQNIKKIREDSKNIINEELNNS